MRLSISLLALLILLLSTTQVAQAAKLRIAVASNFKYAMTSLVDAYQAQSDDEIVVSYGSTGKHYAQIKNGAPFDLFYAADEVRPNLLVKQGDASSSNHFIYAIGRLVLWSSEENKVDDGAILMSNNFRYLAIANQRLSPYGKAAQEVLSYFGLSNKFKGRIIQGENIAQTFQFVDSGNADLGLVAYSQVVAKIDNSNGSFWLVPKEFHQPIMQRAVIINETKPSLAFFDFTKSQNAQQIIQAAGYELP